MERCLYVSYFWSGGSRDGVGRRIALIIIEIVDFSIDIKQRRTTSVHLIDNCNCAGNRNRRTTFVDFNLDFSAGFKLSMIENDIVEQARYRTTLMAMIRGSTLQQTLGNITGLNKFDEHWEVQMCQLATQMSIFFARCAVVI
jgi:hypothetical protein